MALVALALPVLGAPLDVDLLRLQLAIRQPASCGIGGAVIVSVALALPVLGSRSTLIYFDYSLLFGNLQAVASVGR